MFKKAIKITAFFFVLSCVLYAGVCFYIESHRKEVIEEFEKAFAIHCNGSIEFSNISLSSWTNFPSVFFEVQDLEFSSFNQQKHKEQTIKTKEAKIKLSLVKLICKKIQVKSILIKDATVALITNVDNTGAVIPNKVNKQNGTKKDFPLEKNTRLVIENLQLSIVNYQKNKKFQFQVNKIDTDLNISDHAISGRLDLDVIVSDLAFNTKNGSFFNGAQVSGTLKPTINLESKKIDIPEFDLQVDDQVFEVSSKMNLEGPGSFLFSLENDKTNYLESIQLLPEKIQSKLRPYSLEKPLFTNTTIEGSFAPKSNPIVNVQFKTENNRVNIKDKIEVDKVALSGKFINRIYDDERSKTESIKNARLLIDSLKGEYKEVGFKIEEASLTSTPEVKTKVTGKLISEGKTEQLNKVLGSDTFLFENGTFKINATINGDATYIDNLINKSTLSLQLQNSSIVNKNTDLHIPIKSLFLDVFNKNAFLKDLEIEMPSKDKINLSGEIKNIANIVVSDNENKTSSNIKIHSDKLVWNDFTAIIQATKSKTKKKSKNTFQETLKDIYTKFNPSISVFINELVYKSLEIKDLKTGVYYENTNNLFIENTRFSFNNSTVNLSGKLNLKEPNLIKVNANVATTGITDDLNTIFDNDKFLFKNGTFNLNADVSGDLKHIDKLLAKANSTIKLQNSNIYFQPKDVTVAVNELDVIVENNNANLNKLELELESGDKIDFTGKLENIEGLLNKDSEQKVSTYLNVYSEKLAWTDFKKLLQKDKNLLKKNKPKKTLKETLEHIYIGFNPSLNVVIDHFVYNEDVSVDQFKTGIHFERAEKLKLNKTSFTYGEKGKVNLSVDLNVEDPNVTLIETEIKATGNPEQLNTIFKNDNFFFESGEFSFETSTKGDISKLDDLVVNANSVLKVANTSVKFKELLIPIPELEVSVLENDAMLKTLDVVLDSGDKINVSGEVDNLTTLLFNKENALPVKSQLHVHSTKLSFDDFTNLFSVLKKDKKHKKAKNNLNTTIHHIYDHFDPTLTVNIDHFTYNSLKVDNLKTNIHFESANKLFLENTGFDFYKGNVNLNAHLDINKEEETLFSLAFTANKLDLEKALYSFDYFGLEVLKEADRIGGELILDGFVQGGINKEKGLQTNSLNGEISFDLEDIEIEKFKPITNITDKIFKKHRFDDIRFAPIKNTLYLSNNIVEIPQFEISSNVFHLFVEGHLGFGEKDTNIWASVPLGNLKQQEVVDIPDKKGYIDAGKKVFIEITSKKNEKTKYQLHLTNKKLYEQKNILSQYKKKCIEEYKLRRKHKREKRQNKV